MRSRKERIGHKDLRFARNTEAFVAARWCGMDQSLVVSRPRNLSVKGEARFRVGQEARSVSGKAKGAKCAARERLVAGTCSRP